MDRRNFNQTLKYTPKTWSFMLYFFLLILVFYYSTAEGQKV